MDNRMARSIQFHFAKSGREMLDPARQGDPQFHLLIGGGVNILAG
jgi:hypothetical protein